MSTPKPPDPLPKDWLAWTRYRFKLIKDRPASLKEHPPAWAIGLWTQFETWDAWLSKGGKPPRPVGLKPWPKHTKDPVAASWPWTIRGELLKKRKKPHPPPPPGPPSDVKLVTVPPVFLRKMVLSTWAPHTDPNTGERGGPDAVTLARDAKEAGAESIAFQWEPTNLGELPNYFDQARAVGLTVGLWEQVNDSHRSAREVADSLTRFRAQFSIPCVEGDYAPFDPIELRQIVGGAFPLALLTTWVGINRPEQSAPWIAAGYTCMTESYLNADPNASPGAGDRMAYWRGWPPWKVIDKNRPLREGYLHTIPCIGLFWQAGFGQYVPHLQPWGKAFSAYCIETMTPENRRDMAAVS